MIQSRKKRRNKYRESRLRRLKVHFGKIRVFFVVCVAFCLIALLGAGLTRLYHSLLDASWLKIDEIEITGLKKLDRYEALNTLGVRRGECMLNLRMRPLAERLKVLSVVKTASVRLDSPSRIVAEITEREPIAVLNCADVLIPVDDEGVLFGPAIPEEERRVPLVTGMCGQGMHEGASIPARHLDEIKALVNAFDNTRNWLSAGSIRECQWTSGGFTLVLGERAVPVDIGRQNYERKLAKLEKVIRTINERQWNEMVTRIGLDFPGKAYLEGSFPVPRSAQGQGKQSG
ncbi:MAG: cell division protein FtsQ/DivIB [Desulfobacteraceae bacterium]|nr:cell division protein FtsQ/DivIB [Desulfobacteraceae bacterium]